MEPASIIGILDFSLKRTQNIIQYSTTVKGARKEMDQLQNKAQALKIQLELAKNTVKSNHFDNRHDWFTQDAFESSQLRLTEVENRLKSRQSRRQSLLWPFQKENLQNDLRALQDHYDIIQGDIIRKVHDLTWHMINKEFYTWLSDLDPSKRHIALESRRHPGTGSWLIQSSAFETWISSSNPSLLWIHGLPGSGKSVQASTIIDHVSSHCKSGEERKFGFAYFYFDFSDSDYKDYSKMIRSLLKHLGHCSRKADGVLLQQLNGFWVQNLQPSFEGIFSCFRELLKQFKMTYIVLDALDECDDWPRLAEALVRILGWQEKLKILLISRKEPRIQAVINDMEIKKTVISFDGIGVDNDMRAYIGSKWKSDFRFWAQDQTAERRAEMEDQLVRKAGGMFQWLECQVIELQNFGGPGTIEALEQMLNSLPEGLDETYARILRRVTEKNRQKVLKLLRWVSFSARPLVVREVAEALAVESDDMDDTMKFDPTSRLTCPCNILLLCPGMFRTVLATKKGRVSPEEVIEEDEIRLAHFSVKEYLRSNAISTMGLECFRVEENLTNQYQARACLAYLAWVHSHGQDLTEETVAKYPLATYSAQYWHMHTRACALHESSNLMLFHEVCHLLQSDNLRLTSIRLFDPDEARPRHCVTLANMGKPRYGATLADIGQPIYYAARFGLPHHLQLLIDNGALVEDPDDFRKRPLRAACLYGFVSVVRILLENNACFPGSGDDQVWEDAAQSGNVDVAKLLLAKERETTNTPRSHIQAVKKACDDGFMDIIQLLVVDTEGTDVNSVLAETRERDGRLLHAAAKLGHNHMVSRFLEMGAEIDAEGGWWGSAIRAAALQGHEIVVKTLMAAGANPHLRGGSPGSPLLVALDFDRTSIFHLLLQDSRVNVNHDEGFSGTILQYAVATGKVEAVRKLLEKGANVNAEGGVYHTALQAACSKGFKNIVDLLLEYGALPDVPEDGPSDVLCMTLQGEIFPKLIRIPYFRSGLLTQDEWKNEKLLWSPWDFKDEELDVFLEAKPLCTIQKGKFGSALRAAASGGHADIVRILLEKGANTNVNGGALGSVLDIAKHVGNQETERLLLAVGVTEPGPEQTNQIEVSPLFARECPRIQLKGEVVD